jgi:hypothetical protein
MADTLNVQLLNKPMTISFYLGYNTLQLHPLCHYLLHITNDLTLLRNTQDPDVH